MESELALLLRWYALLKIEPDGSACLVFKENHNHCNIVDHPLLSLPAVSCLLNQVGRRSFRVFSLIEGDDKASDFVIGYPIPEAIWSYDEDLIDIMLQTFERFDFWIAYDTNLLGD
jgi:hypothetical protein